MDLGLYLPLIKSKGRYEINGQVLLFPIASHGEFYAEFSKISDLTSTRKCFQTLQCRLTAFYGDRRNRLGVDRRFFIFPADINAIAKIYGKQITKNNEAYMTIEKMVVDFVMKGARFRVKDMGQGKSLSKKL